MLIRDESIGHYIDWMQRGQRFALAGYSDAEWNCILGNRLGERTALGQVIDWRHGRRLAEVLKHRVTLSNDHWFKVAVPKVLHSLPGFSEGQIDWWLGNNGIVLEAWERDRVTDDLAKNAELRPFIDQLQTMRTVVIGPPELKDMTFLRVRRFVPIDGPNLHLKEGGIEDAVDRALFRAHNGDTVFLVSAGVSAAVIIDKIWSKLTGSCWAIDCGSIWDAFVGIGGQRAWRAELYADRAKWQTWVDKNLGDRQWKIPQN